VLRTSINPDLYHGHKKKADFFEGWYFKLVHPSNRFTYCFIPGIIMSEFEGGSHSFIQFLDGAESKFEYLQFPVEDFSAHWSRFDISIDRNHFSLNNISVNIDRPGLNIAGSLSFKGVEKWPDSSINPGSMGFYNYLSFMQCYSQVCCMTADIKGSLNINNKILDFDGGRAYIEKNWGKAFPYSYIWLQCNSFKTEEASISCSIGHIPFPLGSFTGFLIGFQAKDTFYKFTSINRSKLKIGLKGNEISLEVRNSRYALVLLAHTEEDKFMDLFAPRDNRMVPIARETLQGIVRVKLLDLKSGKILFEDTGSAAGVEFSGDYEKLAANLK
jgi:tocopherol cyclase